MREKLEKLLALASDDGAPDNEARSAAIKMVRLAKQHGYVIGFVDPPAKPGRFQEFVEKGAGGVVAEVFVPDFLDLEVEAIREWNNPGVHKWPKLAREVGAAMMPTPRLPIETCEDCKRPIPRDSIGFCIFKEGILPWERDEFTYFHPRCLKARITRRPNAT